MQNQRFVAPGSQVRNQIRNANPVHNFTGDQIRPRYIPQSMNRPPAPTSKTVEQQTGA